ncbi:MAG: toll/interleukin-1 receptor domain-containing protein [Planctomycetaceae bacterium]|nr:toll/interleukin-1 receptor domain-containing protein [Planctomycetaceae bacterium]
MTGRPRVAVSYAWREEREGQNTKAVESFCERLKAAGIDVVRDTEHLGYGQSIRNFMRDIGRSGYLCVFLSDAYLKSPNCMYELLIAFQHDRDNLDRLAERLNIWQMPGMPKIAIPPDREPIILEWKTVRQRYEESLQRLGPEERSSESQRQYDDVRDIHQNVDLILTFATTHRSPRTWDEFADWMIRKYGGNETAPMDAKDVFTNILRELDSVLERHTPVAELLSKCLPGEVVSAGGRFVLKRDLFVGDEPWNGLVQGLRCVVDSMHSLQGNAGDWRALGEVCSGLTVLGINRDWIARQRSLARQLCADFPADQDVIEIGDGTQVNLLYLVACALADGIARLDEVFGEPPVDGRRIPSLPVVGRGITPDDKLREIKVHLIWAVLPKEEIQQDEKRLETQFNRVRQIIDIAFNDDHRPYHATGDEFQKHYEQIRQNLQLKDLLLIFPNGEDPGTMLVEYVRVLQLLNRISETIKQKTQTTAG